MKIFRRTALNTFLTGTVGFLIASFSGIFSSYLIFRLNIFRPFLRLVPEDQFLIRLYTGIVITFLGVGVGGVIGGLIRGETLYRIDPQGSQRRYLLGGAFAYGISGGLLLIPVLLFLALLSQYNPGSAKDPFTFLVIFTIIGALYGLFSGLLLVLVTLRLRYIWLPWLASILGTALGGTLLGVVIWRQDSILPKGSTLLQSIVFLLFLGLALVGLAGGLIAMAYRWTAGRRERIPGGSIGPRRWQDVFIVVAGIFLVFLMISLSGTIVNFITIHTGTTTTSLNLETQGVRWGMPFPITSKFLPYEGSTYAIGISPQGSLAVVWTSQDGGLPQVYYAYSKAGIDNLSQWSSTVRVTQDPAISSKHPQLIQDAAGSRHIIWTAETGATSEIRYSRCQGDTCSSPVTLSGPGGMNCVQSSESDHNDWPAIAISNNGTLTVAWNADGLLAYKSWDASEQPPQTPAACMKPLLSDLPVVDWQPRLAAWGQDGIAMVYSSSDPNQNAPLALANLGKNGWGSSTQIGQGALAEVYADSAGTIHLAWCGADGKLSYALAGGATEIIDFPPCISRPGIFQDQNKRLHLVWASDQVENNFAVRLPDSLIYESILTEDGWSEPASIASVDQAFLSTAAMQDGTAVIVYQTSIDEAPALMVARQNGYLCSPENLTNAGQAVYNIIQSGSFHPSGYQSPFCGNRFDGFIFMPNPLPSFSTETPTQNGGFDRLAALIQETRYELLLSNMQWDQDLNKFSPGYHIVEGIADLYHQIKADPTRFPRGLTIRILLGNFPNLATFQFGDQIWNVIQDLREAGIDRLEDPSIGWKLEVANFRGAYPHSHTKFMVIDGKTLLSAGFNISWFHLPGDHISGKGDSLTDLGILISGPIAQEGLSVFDDVWTDANQLTCADLQPGDPTDNWRQSCAWKTAQPEHTPEVLKYYLTGENQASFALYRTDVYKEADTGYTAALRSAQTSIDAIQVNFSAGLICILNIVSPGTCTYADALPWMEALVNAVEQNHTRVRVIVEKANMNGLENRVAINILKQELSRLGLEEFVEVRFFDGRLHMKATLVDDELLFVGSQNFHYSSFGKTGLLEFVAATESPEAIQTYREMFDYYWRLATPVNAATVGLEK